MVKEEERFAGTLGEKTGGATVRIWGKFGRGLRFNCGEAIGGAALAHR